MTRLRITGLAVAGVTALAASLVSVQTAPADPDAYQILARAKGFLQRQTYPDTIFYTTTIQVSEGDKEEFEHFHAEAFSDSDVRVRGVGDEEQAAPHESEGVNFKLAFTIGWNTAAGGQSETDSQDVHRKEATPDYLGIPLISPSYSFGLLPKRDERTAHVPPEAENLRTIATVTSIDRTYDVSLAGTETIGGLYTYHLVLKPTIRPDRYRIRDLWVDAYTYQPVQMRTQGNFANAPMSDVPWLITFQDVDGSIYIESETAMAPLAFRHDRTFSSATITFDDIRTEDASPPILPTISAQGDLREP